MAEAIGTRFLELRRRPTQDRAVKTFAEILDTTGRLVETHGFDAVTTNLISAESAVSVRAIYRYFPNKHAIVVELARRMAAQWRESLADAGSFDDLSTPWRDLWCAYIDTFVSSVRSTPGGRAVLLAMRSDPDLRRVDDEANQLYIDEIADVLQARTTGLTASGAIAVATVLIRSTVGVLDEAFEAEEHAAIQMVELLTTMQLDLLARYLD